MKFVDSVLMLVIFFSAALLAGCQKSPERKTHTSAEQVVVPTAAEMEAAQLKQCQETLETLRTVNAKQYTQYQKTFEQLMKGAAQYSGIRDRIKDDTQDTVDALYRYRVSKLCAQVDQAVLLSLTETGESAQ